MFRRGHGTGAGEAGVVGEPRRGRSSAADGEARGGGGDEDPRIVEAGRVGESGVFDLFGALVLSCVLRVGGGKESEE